MKHNRFRGTEKSRRGFSIVEVVVGLTIVVMVSAAALSVIMASVQMEAKYLNETTALCACESVVACVRFAEDSQGLAEALEKLAEDGSVVALDIEDDIVFQVKQNTVLVSVRFEPVRWNAEGVVENPDAFTKFEITAATQSGETIHQVKYEKN